MEMHQYKIPSADQALPSSHLGTVIHFHLYKSKSKAASYFNKTVNNAMGLSSIESDP